MKQLSAFRLLTNNIFLTVILGCIGFIDLSIAKGGGCSSGFEKNNPGFGDQKNIDIEKINQTCRVGNNTSGDASCIRYLKTSQEIFLEAMKEREAFCDLISNAKYADSNGTPFTLGSCVAKHKANLGLTADQKKAAAEICINQDPQMKERVLQATKREQARLIAIQESLSKGISGVHQRQGPYVAKLATLKKEVDLGKASISCLNAAPGDCKPSTFKQLSQNWDKAGPLINPPKPQSGTSQSRNQGTPDEEAARRAKINGPLIAARNKIVAESLRMPAAVLPAHQLAATLIAANKRDKILEEIDYNNRKKTEIERQVKITNESADKIKSLGKNEKIPLKPVPHETDVASKPIQGPDPNDFEIIGASKQHQSEFNLPSKSVSNPVGLVNPNLIAKNSLPTKKEHLDGILPKTSSIISTKSKAPDMHIAESEDEGEAAKTDRKKHHDKYYSLKDKLIGELISAQMASETTPNQSTTTSDKNEAGPIFGEELHPNVVEMGKVSMTGKYFSPVAPGETKKTMANLESDPDAFVEEKDAATQGNIDATTNASLFDRVSEKYHQYEEILVLKLKKN